MYLEMFCNIKRDICLFTASYFFGSPFWVVVPKRMWELSSDTRNKPSGTVKKTNGQPTSFPFFAY